MNLSSWAITTVAIVASLSGCSANVGTSAGFSVPRDSQTTCATYCSNIGMGLDSVVIMANNVGCVCRGPKGSAQTSEGGAVSAGGMAALIVDEQQRQQQQQTYR